MKPVPAILLRALDLAERGRYTVAPNPMVGAVIARGDRVVGEGWHARAGGPHAEIRALTQAGARSRGADLYVTLEPCVHFGRTPPCAPALLESGIRRVVLAARDPNPRVSGRGVRALRSAGIDVVEVGGELRARAERQNEKFRTWVAQGRPFVLAKWAQTLDGKIADEARRSRWITGPLARRRALLLREEYDAILVGAETVIADDPLLTRRLGRARARPHRRIVLDGRLRVPLAARLFRQPSDVIVATTAAEIHPRARRLRALGVDVRSFPARDARVDVRRLLESLARDGVASVLVEGGGETVWSFLQARRVDRVLILTAPKLLGGAGAPGPIGGTGLSLARAVEVVHLEHERVGRDWLVTGLVTG